MYHFHYMLLSNGELVSKRKVDDAIDLLAKLKGGVSLVQMTDMDLFTRGDKFEAIKRFHEKHDVSLLEAKAAIEFLRGDDLHE